MARQETSAGSSCRATGRPVPQEEPSRQPRGQRRRLQGHRRAARVHLGTRQNPLPPRHRSHRPTTTTGRHRDQERARNGAVALPRTSSAPAPHGDSPAPRHRAPVHRHRLHRLCGRPESVGDRRTTSHHPALSTRHARRRPVHARPTHVRISPDGRHGCGAAVHKGPASLRTDALDRPCHRQRRRGRPAGLARARVNGKTRQCQHNSAGISSGLAIAVEVIDDPQRG